MLVRGQEVREPLLRVNGETPPAQMTWAAVGLSPNSYTVTSSIFSIISDVNWSKHSEDTSNCPPDVM
jgi:hypothetical protein